MTSSQDGSKDAGRESGKGGGGRREEVREEASFLTKNTDDLNKRSSGREYLANQN